MDFIKFAQLIGKSKKIKRTGWVREGVKNPESVADHSFRLVVLAMVLGPLLKVDRNKLVKMAIVHDLGETVTGDIVIGRWGKVDKELQKNKYKMEGDAIRKMFQDSPEYIDVFEEMLEKKTKTAKIFKQLDKLEMAFQALEYEQEQGKDLTEFFVDTDAYIMHPFLRKIFEELESLRKK